MKALLIALFVALVLFVNVSPASLPRAQRALLAARPTAVQAAAGGQGDTSG